MKLNEIQDLIKFVSKSGVSEVELQTKDVKIVIRTPAAKSILKQNGDAPVIIQATPPVVNQQAPVVNPSVSETTPAESKKKTPPPTASGEDESRYITIKSPMIGTMYRSSGPDKPPFINVGDEIKAGKVICIIEAMKLFNEIESDVAGKIVKVLVNDATPVEYDQPLFLVDPS